MSGAFYIARHGETVFNAAARMQGDAPHTPLTRAGFAQAEAMGRALRDRLGPQPALELWSSPSGRALQTLAVIAEHLELDWHRARTDARLREMDVGAWSGLYYRDIVAEAGAILDSRTGLFSCRPPGGEWYDAVAARLRAWLGEHCAQPKPRLVVMHGMSSRILRGILTAAPIRPGCAAAVADGLPQGSVVEICEAAEKVLYRAEGSRTVGGT